MACIKVYFLYVPCQRCCIGSTLKSAMLVMLVKSSACAAASSRRRNRQGIGRKRKSKAFCACLAAQESERPTTYHVIKYRKIHRVQRRCVCRQNIKTSEKMPYSCRSGFIIRILYTATKRLRARKIGLQYFVPSFVPQSPGRRAVRRRGYDLRFLIFKMANNKVDLGQIRSEEIVYNRFINIPLG